MKDVITAWKVICLTMRPLLNIKEILVVRELAEIM